MQHKFFWLLSVCLILCSFHCYSQQAKFKADINAGCSPLIVTFTNESTGFSGSEQYEFNFGEGGQLPYFPVSSHTYLKAQTYTAVLTITDNGISYRDTELITVYKKPVVDFLADVSKACVKTGVDYTSNSTPGDGTITSYLWDFQDGTLDSSGEIVQHKYTSAKSENVYLKVTNSYGCFNSVTKNGIVTTLAAPRVSFTADQTSLCNVSDAVTFTNTTSGGALPTSYLWNFGDGNSSTAVSPAHSYGIRGQFNIRLLATSSEGCTDTSKSTTITVASSKSGITLPTLLCLNANLTFIDSSSPQTNNPVWMLDGAVAATDVHQFMTTFTDTKTHKLQLANSYGACSDTATKIIQAQAAPVPAPFIINIPNSCSIPATATFTDVGTGSTKWEWDFNNVNASDFNPTAYTQSANYTYIAENTYYVKLRVTDSSGCTGEVRQPVTIKLNKTTITSSEGVFGCRTLATTFTATSTNPIASYNWTFSDDNSTSVLPAPQHIFAGDGTYTAFLNIKTTGGCNDKDSLKIHVGNKPSFDFGLVTPGDTLVCGNKIVNFNVIGDTNETVGQYYWKFGDAPNYTLFSGPTYSHQYLTDSLYTVSLAINNHGCNDTLTKTAFLRVLPPFSKISAVITSCDDRLKVVFKEGSRKAQTYSWNFNDGSPAYTYDSLHRDTSIVHYFPKTGGYNTVLTTTNNGCTARDSLYARVLKKQQPILTTNQTILCASDTLKTTVSNMDLNPYGSGNRYAIKSIEYQNNLPFTGTYSILNVYPVVPFYLNITKLTPGNQNIRVITSSYGLNCLDTTNYIPIQVNGPKAGFEVANNTFCLSDRILFTDTSKAGGDAQITSWQWLFGDSTSQTLTSGGDIFHKYDNPGNFKVKLVVTDAQNCRDTAYYVDTSLAIKGPKARFSIEQNPILPNTAEIFTNLTDSGNITRVNNSYNWNFGDGATSSSNADKVSHSYKLYSDDTVILVAASNTTGCSDTASSIVHVKNTNLSFTYTLQNPNTICPPVQVNFKNTSLNFDVVSWDFGDGLTADNINAPSHIYNTPGTFKVTIFGYYSDNTYDSTWDYITISGPTAVLHADVVPGCGSKQVIFTAQTQNITSLSWDFQDGTSSTDSVVSHTYKTPNIYTPVLTVKNGDKCLFSYPLETPVAIDSMHISINKDSVIECHQLLVNFKPTVYSIAKENGQAIDYTWQFGDGISSSKDDTTSFTYTKPGVYPVTFVATSPYGCTDTAITQITFADLPHATIQGPTEFCENTSQLFTAVKTNSSDVLTYNWQFENSTSTLQNPPAQTFSAAWKDSIRLIVNNNNCFDTVYQKLDIHGQPNVAIQLSDSIACLGSAIVFQVKPITTLPETVNYIWNFGGGITSDQPSTSYTYGVTGTYPITLLATSAFGCSQQLKDTVTIAPVPTAAITALSDLCVGGMATFLGSSDVASSQYFWHFSDGTTSTLQNPAPKTYTSAVTDNFYLVASIGNCHDTAFHSLTVHDLPLADLTPLTPRVCLGDSIQLTAHNGQNYQWLNAAYITSTSVANPYVFPVINTNYTVQVTDSYGCKNVDSINVFVTQPQKISVASPVNVCAGNKASLIASGTDTYNWIDGTDLTSVSIANPTTKDSAQNKTYTVEGADAYGCFTDQATVEVIVRDKPIVDAGASQTIPAGTSAQLSATSSGNIVSWSWQPPLYLSCSNCASPISKLRESTTYTVQATDNYGCKGSDTVKITVICKESLVNVPQIFSPNGDGKNDKFRMTAIGVKTITHFVIYGRSGNKVYEKNNISPLDNDASWDGMSNNQYMSTGTYIYIIQAVCDAGQVYNLQGTVTLIR